MTESETVPNVKHHCELCFVILKAKQNSTFISHNHFLSLYNLNDNAHKQEIYIFI